MLFPHGFTLEVLDQTIDVYGDRTESVTTSIPGCAWWPSDGGAEDTDKRNQVTRTARVILPPGRYKVSPQAKIRVPAATAGDPDPTVWEVDGDTTVWAHPITGWNPGGIINVRRVTG